MLLIFVVAVVLQIHMMCTENEFLVAEARGVSFFVDCVSRTTRHCLKCPFSPGESFRGK
jgi:hypothetical protein